MLTFSKLANGCWQKKTDSWMNLKICLEWQLFGVPTWQSLPQCEGRLYFESSFYFGILSQMIKWSHMRRSNYLLYSSSLNLRYTYSTKSLDFKIIREKLISLLLPEISKYAEILSEVAFHWCLFLVIFRPN